MENVYYVFLKMNGDKKYKKGNGRQGGNKMKNEICNMHTVIKWTISFLRFT